MRIEANEYVPGILPANHERTRLEGGGAYYMWLVAKVYHRYLFILIRYFGGKLKMILSTNQFWRYKQLFGTM